MAELVQVVIVLFVGYFIVSLLNCLFIRFGIILMGSRWDGRVEWEKLRWSFLCGKLDLFPILIYLLGGVLIEIFNLITDGFLGNKWRKVEGYRCDFSEPKKIIENGEEKESQGRCQREATWKSVRIRNLPRRYVCDIHKK